MRNQAVRNVEPVVGSSFRVIGYNADVAVATLDDFVLLLWRRRIVPAGVSWARQAFAKLAEKLGARADVGITNAVEAINSSNASNANFRTKTVSLVLAVRM